MSNQSETFKVMTFGRENGIIGVYIFDMKFIDGKPNAIFEYSESPSGKDEIMTVMALDPLLLQKIQDKKADYFYQGEIVFPRPTDN